MLSPYYLPYNRWNNRMLAQKFPVKRVNKCGIPKLKTKSVNVDTEASTVVYQICPWQWKQICADGLILLKISNTVPATADSFLVSIQVSESEVTSAIPLLNGSGDQVASSEVIFGNTYLVNYDECDNTFQLVNYIPAATAP